MPAPSSSGRQSDDQLVRSAPLSLSSPRPFAEGVVAPSKTSTPKKRQEAAHDLQRTSRDVYRRASFLEEKSAAGSRAPLRRQNGMSVKEEEQEEEQEEEGGGVTAAQRHLPNKEKGFHLSLPEIALGDEEVEEGSNNHRHDHHRHRHRHHHHHHRHRRCRTETERKISSESSCSGMDSGAGSTSSMFQRFSQLKKRADNGGGQQQHGNLQRSQTTTACDSGLGTPSSQSILKPASAAAAAASTTAARPAEGDEEDAEEREIQVIRFVREKEVSGDGGTRGSKWKSSVTGK